MSCGLRPAHSVKTICWFSPMSGIASTGTGSRGSPAISESKGATSTPQKSVIASPIATTSFCSRQKRMRESRAFLPFDCIRASLMIVTLMTILRTFVQGSECLANLAAAEHAGAKVGIAYRLAPLEPVRALVVESHRAVSEIPSLAPLMPEP